MFEPNPEGALCRGRAWSIRYATKGQVWGEAPSTVTRTFLERKLPQGLVADIGCGYGRDALICASEWHDVYAVDPAQGGLQAGAQEYDRLCQIQRMGEVQFVWGTIHMLESCQRLHGQFDAILCNRTLHMLDDAQLAGFAAASSTLLKPGGVLIVSGESPCGFNPKKEHWVKGREGREVWRNGPSNFPFYFVSASLMKETFSSSFNIEDIRLVADQPKGRDDGMRFTMLTATRKVTL